MESNSLEIILSRYPDGTYFARIPAFHDSFCKIGRTKQDAIRQAQAAALNLMADFIRGNRKMPDEMRDWFHVVDDTDTKISVGGCQHDEIHDRHLIKEANDVIPVAGTGRHKPNRPGVGTPEYHELVKSIRQSESDVG